tara:strand:- start:26765 stop:26980 length:216 start_codon:yes stop_codon:yes gene_type:complete
MSKAVIKVGGEVIGEMKECSLETLGGAFVYSSPTDKVRLFRREVVPCKETPEGSEACPLGSKCKYPNCEKP